MRKPPGWTIPTWLVAAIAVVLVGPGFVEAEPIDPAKLTGSIEIAAPEDALTFGRISTASGLAPILVADYRDGLVTAIDLKCLDRSVGRDAIEVFEAQGYDKLRQLAENPPKYCRRVFDAAGLVMPVDLSDHHVAAGTNYAEHAGEATVEGGPFLFAKMVAPTASRSKVAAGRGLLDYEVELAWVALAPMHRLARTTHMGLILCNDYTDRETLLREIDILDIESGKGFTTGKSFPGYLPVGNLFVIPADYRSFAKNLQLRLYVNGELRQDASVAQAIWDIDELIAKTWEWQDRRWDHRGQTVSLLAKKDVIGARTMLMGGTPSGTAFQGLPWSHRIGGIGAWLLGGWDKSMTEHIIADYAEEARKEGRYLVPGDRVVIRVDRMGVIDNEIE